MHHHPATGGHIDVEMPLYNYQGHGLYVVCISDFAAAIYAEDTTSSREEVPSEMDCSVRKKGRKEKKETKQGKYKRKRAARKFPRLVASLDDLHRARHSGKQEKHAETWEDRREGGEYCCREARCQAQGR